VKPTYGLTDEQVEGMILDSFEFAEADIDARQVIEARNEAELVLNATEKGLRDENISELSNEERAEIDASVSHLQDAMKSDSHTVIREAIDRLSKATQRLAELNMNSAIRVALKDKRVREVQ
jgi:molecular chaperone DnaK (HSP70)